MQCLYKYKNHTWDNVLHNLNVQIILFIIQIIQTIFVGPVLALELCIVGKKTSGTDPLMQSALHSADRQKITTINESK